MCNTEMKLPGWAVELLCCPACGNFLDFDGENVRCQNEECASVFPVIGGVPVFLDYTEDRSQYKRKGKLQETCETSDRRFKKSQGPCLGWSHQGRRDRGAFFGPPYRVCGDGY